MAWNLIIDSFYGSNPVTQRLLNYRVEYGRRGPFLAVSEKLRFEALPSHELNTLLKFVHGNKWDKWERRAQYGKLSGAKLMHII